MHFEVEQRLAADPDAVATAYADAGLYALFGELPKLSAPEVLDRVEEGSTVRLAIRYRFTGDLSSAARRVLDPGRLTWVERSTHDLAARTVQYRLEPDHYADRFESNGASRFEPDGAGTRRVARGDVTVRALVVGPLVERAIVSGLREHLDAEVGVVERYLAAR
jgi:hypothetical protein